MVPSSLFFSHIRPVVSSVIVPSPLSVKDRLAPDWLSPSLPTPYDVVCPVGSVGRRHSGKGPPASAAETSSVWWATNDASAVWSPLDGHIPPPADSIVGHLKAYFSSHFE